MERQDFKNISNEITAVEAARISGYSYSNIVRAFRAGQINGRRFGRVIILYSDSVIEYKSKSDAAGNARFAPHNPRRKQSD